MGGPMQPVESSRQISVPIASERFRDASLVLLLRKAAKDAIVAETLHFAKRGLETNGMLLGNMRFNETKNTFICEVAEATDSGPRASHESWTTDIDVNYQGKRQSEAAARGLSRLGFWHSHPHYLTEPSNGDHLQIMSAGSALYIALITTIQAGESVPRVKGFAFYYGLGQSERNWHGRQFIMRPMNIYMEKIGGRFDFFDASAKTVTHDV